MLHLALLAASLFVLPLSPNPAWKPGITGDPTFRMSGNSHIYYDAAVLAMSIGLLPPVQLGYREISSDIDP